MPLTYSGKLTDPKTCPVGVWTTVVPSLSFPSGAHVHALLYVNVTGLLEDGRTSGAFDVKAIRTGTTDDTAWDTRTVSALVEGGGFTCFVTHKWLGENPKAFTWQIRPRVGIHTLTVNTRYAKGLSA